MPLILSHNANLCLWNKTKNPNCTLHSEQQSLIHVLNACGVAREKHCYKSRHDAVLQEILRKYLPPPVQFTVDLGSYNFPQHIVLTDLRPDIVWWDDNQKVIFILELTIAFETSFQSASKRKRIKYEPLMSGPEGLATQLLSSHLRLDPEEHLLKFKKIFSNYSRQTFRNF